MRIRSFGVRGDARAIERELERIRSFVLHDDDPSLKRIVILWQSVVMIESA